MKEDKALNIVLFAIGFACALCILVLVLARLERVQKEDPIARCDDIIARSERSIERWNHSRR